MIAISLQSIRPSRIMKLDRRTMDALTQYCTYGKWSNVVGSSGEEAFHKLGFASGMLIYPGTKWCGAGNISESYDDLGPEIEADMCCRDHDHCDDSIEAFGSKHGLDNNSPFTKSHCKCDEVFYECLRTADTEASNSVGKIFFNYIRMECFKLEHPIRTCSRYKGYIRPRCVEYDLDSEQEPIWQFFDAKEYNAISEGKKMKSNKQDVFEYMLSPSSPVCNRTNSEENKQRIFKQLEKLTLQDILSKDVQNPVSHKGVLSHKAKRAQLGYAYFESLESTLNPC